MLFYVCTPYSKYPDGIDNAFKAAALACAKLMGQGIAVFSPIVHTHPIAMMGHIDPYDHDFWMPVDAPMMDLAAGCIIVQMPGWEESKGIQIEIAEFKKAGKPIRYFTWPDMKEMAHAA